MVEQTLADELERRWAHDLACDKLPTVAHPMMPTILAALRSESTGAGEAEVCGWCEREMIDGSCDLCETSNPAPERARPTDATATMAVDATEIAAQVLAWVHYGIAWQHMERVSQDDVREEAKQALAQLPSNLQTQGDGK